MEFSIKIQEGEGLEKLDFKKVATNYTDFHESADRHGSCAKNSKVATFKIVRR
jgi:hypothetical protein